MTNQRSHPNLKFQLNKHLDKKMCAYFLGHKKAGIDFGGGITKLYPQLTHQAISKFVDNYYQEHEAKLEAILETFKNLWQGCKKDFYHQVTKIFKDHPWPEGKYICYLSIFDCNPRFLKNKTFQVFFQHPQGICSVAAHEMLHFMFYDYVEKGFPEAAAKIGKDKLWEVSEIFNVLVLPDSKPYPNHIKLIPKYEKTWKTAKDIDQFLRAVLV